MMRATVFLRVAAVAVLAIVVLVCVYGYGLGRAAVVMAPALAPYRTPLYVGGLVGTLPVLAGVMLAFDFSTLLQRGEDGSPRATRVLRRLRLALVVTAVYLLVCVVRLGTVLDRLGLGMPGVWLAALVAEVALLSLVVVVTRALAYRRSTSVPR